MLRKIIEKNEKGFTLIELMIVIAIIGILAAIAIPQFSAYRIRSYNSSSQADLRNAATAQEAYFVDWDTYADTTSKLVAHTNAYGYFPTPKVILTIVAGSTDTQGYFMKAWNNSGDRSFYISGPGGVLDDL
jgi:type IV pilus assembly protein PilA